jgi:hypothetical protein
LSESSPQCSILLEKLAAAQLVKKFPSFYVTQRITNMFKEPITGLSAEPDESIPYSYALLKIHINIILT